MATVLVLAAAVGCTGAVDRGEVYVGPSRELWDDGRPDVRADGATAEIVDDGAAATLTFADCTVTLVRVGDQSDPRRRFELDGDTQTCAAGTVEQALVGDPVRREPPEPGAELSIEMWLTREDGAPSLIEFTGQRVD
ncbi:MAG TPA: hypothetical protein VM513_01645 [Kofleriaceae bacterium]|nr:hypothetical protein [Kofleriaceae bacterium]